MEDGIFVHVLDCEDLKLIADLSPPQPDNWIYFVKKCWYVPEHNRILVNQSGELRVHDAVSFDLLGTLILPFDEIVNTIALDDSTLLLGGEGGGMDLMAFNVNTVQIIDSWSISDQQFFKALLMGDHLVIVNQDGRIDFLQFPSLEYQASMIVDLEKKEFVLYDSSGVYYGTKQILQYITLTEGLDNYSISQFDAKFNRPHEILSKFDFVDPDKVKLMRQVYDKRMKQGQELSMLEIEASPKLIVAPLAFETRSSFVNVDLKANAAKGKLNRIRVLVNDVPIYGRHDLIISSRLELDTSLGIQLIEGKNEILISVLDEHGAQSAIERRMVNCWADNGKDSVMLITIAVSEFQDSDYNLKYAVKDGRDLRRSFRNKNIGYSNSGFSTFTYSKTELRTDSLFNKNVTRENFIELRDRLQSLRPQDKVVLSMSGHGLLDDQLKWWFATHDMDFSQPGSRGISYEMIMELLASCPSRHKVLLLDACHSGELDRSVAYEYSGDDNIDGVVVRPGSRGAKAKQAVNVGLENSYDLMKEYFLDMNAGTGVHVIAAASGDSYALESDEWENGVFTSSVMSALGVTSNTGGPLISELKEAVTSRVSRLTKGKQQPMTRSGSPKYDFRLFQ